MRIEARGVTAGYGGQPVLHDVSFVLGEGEFVGLIGPNGAGKSTLLRVLSGTLRPSGGAVLLDGEPIDRLKAREIARKLAFVPQTESTLFEFSVRDVVLMGRHPHVRGLAGETHEDFARANQAMVATDILHLADRPITALSGGEHRRVLIARALAQATPAVLLDEPTAHLDITHQAEILSLVRRQADEAGASVLAALHDLNLAAEFCDRLILLADGRVALEGPPTEVLTSLTLERAYGASVTVGRNPASGRPFIFPALAQNEATPNSRRIHVICGGGTGIGLLQALRRRGHVLTAGVLNRLDSDEEACTALGIEHAWEAPFSPIGEAARSRCRELMQDAELLVVTEVPIGRGNLANLELALEAQQAGKSVYLIDRRPSAERDFTGGNAQALFDALERNGAIRVADAAALEACFTPKAAEVIH
jgi:iron complex transport system ATP-binding protein